MSEGTRTPRTDEALENNRGYVNYQLEQLIRVARELELELSAAQQTIVELEHDISRHITICSELAERAESAELALSEAKARISGMQAKIDWLMLEFCPEEMTQEQIDNWAAHQQPVSKKDAAKIDAALQSNPDAKGK